MHPKARLDMSNPALSKTCKLAEKSMYQTKKHFKKNTIHGSYQAATCFGVPETCHESYFIKCICWLIYRLYEHALFK